MNVAGSPLSCHIHRVATTRATSGLWRPHQFFVGSLCHRGTIRQELNVRIVGGLLRCDAAPELLCSHNVCATYASDIWDLGVVIAELLNGEALLSVRGRGYTPSVAAQLLEPSLGVVAAAPERYQQVIAYSLAHTIKVHIAAARH